MTSQIVIYDVMSWGHQGLKTPGVSSSSIWTIINNAGPSQIIIIGENDGKNDEKMMMTTNDDDNDEYHH